MRLYVGGPELFIERYFLGPDGKPDRSKTPHAITIEIWYRSDSLPFGVRDAAKAVPGLIVNTDTVGISPIVFLSWTEAGMEKEKKRFAMEHASREVEDAIPLEIREEREREARQLTKHFKYLHGLQKRPSDQGPSIIGQHLVRCPGIEKVFPATWWGN